MEVAALLVSVEAKVDQKTSPELVKKQKLPC